MDIDLGGVEQLVETSQTRAVADALDMLARSAMTRKLPVKVTETVPWNVLRNTCWFSRRKRRVSAKDGGAGDPCRFGGLRDFFLVVFS